MGNQTVKSQFIPYPAQNSAIVQPIGNMQGIGLTGPQITNNSQGISSAGFCNNFVGCCDSSPSYVPTPGLAPGGYGISPAFIQDDCGTTCCMFDQRPYIVQTKVKTTQLIPNKVTEIITPMRSSVVNTSIPTLSPIKQVIPSSTSIVGGSIVSNSQYIPSELAETIDLSKKFSPKTLAVIEKLSSVTPLRGSVLNRLDNPQYIQQKQAYYQGQWVNCYMNGFGKLYFDNGNYFEGQFVQGNACTLKGLFVYPDGSYYLGGVDKNCANGEGVFNYRNNRLVYKGKFLNDQPDGYGVQTYSDGSKYEGEFRFGKKQGRGKFNWVDGTTYNGQFENGFMQGEGVHSLSNGDIYEGEFRKNKRHGKGRLTTSLGVYFGNFRKDAKEGSGQFSWKDGRTFKGSFKQGKPDGPGTMTLNNGQTVYGLWLNGVVDPNSLSSINTFGSAFDLKGSVVSNGSMVSMILPPGITKGSQIMNGPPILNLPGGIINQGFTGSTSPIPLRGSTLSVLGPGAYSPRTSTFGMGLSKMGITHTDIPTNATVNVPFNSKVSNTAIITTFSNPPKTMILRT